MKSLGTLFCILVCCFSPLLKGNEAILLMGPPGSGKGTFSSFAKQVGYGHISAGDVIREEILSGTDLGRKLEEIVEKGEYVDSDTLFQLVATRVEAFLHKKVPVIIDGYGRTPEDWHRLNAHLQGMGVKRRVILFDAPEKVCVERILDRLICIDCGFITSKKGGRKVGEVCPNCQTHQLSLRMNDNLKVTLKRLKTFHEEIRPLLLKTYAKEEITVFCSDLPWESMEKEMKVLLPL